ncbi:MULTISPECIES: hypothetical protein [unclassified Methanoregula]|uniref:hypothetical protein n=1 Tax=unclassified Methanoregula TaxID=2649730 RepID=UPI0025E42795|nr:MULTISPECIES: hypothetical protein [unclassified Methanoregula]
MRNTLLLLACFCLLVSCACAATAVTVTAVGDRSYYLGEKVIFRGQNTDSDTTYLFITGPNIAAGGGKLTSPRQAVVSGNPDTFTVVKTQPDKTWEFPFYTANLPFDAGSYTLYAVSSPVALNQFGNTTASGTVSIILKKPFISAVISPATVVKGKGFAVTGFAEGDPPEVQVWIIGGNTALAAKTPVNPDASFTFTGTEAVSGNLPAGQYWLFVQHSMQNNRFDIDMSGEWVRNLKLNNGTNVFKISGPGSLQGSDAADALVAAFSDPDIQNEETYTVIPFQVADAGSPITPSTPATTSPVQSPAQSAPLQYAAPIGAGVLLLAGLVLWKRQ